MTTELAIVTGGNRGIGLEICRQLGQRGMRVLLTSRDRSAGEAAARGLLRLGLQVEARVLDVADGASVDALGRSIADETVHVLVNNAGVSLDGFDADVAEQTLAINYLGAARVTDAVLPHMPPGSRVVMVSSGMGELSAYTPEIRERFLAADLSRAGIDALVREFVDQVARGTHASAGWPSSAYRVSKAALNALVRVWAPTLARRGISMNAVCPGWVRTDMGGKSAPRSVEKGAGSAVWAATLPADGPTGGFFRDGEPLDW